MYTLAVTPDFCAEQAAFAVAAPLPTSKVVYISDFASILRVERPRTLIAFTLLVA
jgi:acetylglutamate kinase